MSATEEATINPDGTQTMGGDAYAGAANPGPEADAMGGDDAGADADADDDFTGGEEEGAEEALKDAVEGTDPAIYLLLAFFFIAGLWYYFYLKKKRDEQSSDSFFSEMDGEKFNLKLPASVQEYYEVKAKCEAAGWEPGQPVSFESRAPVKAATKQGGGKEEGRKEPGPLVRPYRWQVSPVRADRAQLLCVSIPCPLAPRAFSPNNLPVACSVPQPQPPPPIRRPQAPQGAQASQSGPHRMLAQALMKRCIADIPIVQHIQKESAGMNKLYSQSMCSVKQWKAYQAAENMVSAEVDDVRSEADEVEPGWSQVIWRQAMQYHQMLKQRHEMEEKARVAQATQKAEAAKKLTPEEEAKMKAQMAEKMAKELIDAEEKDKGGKKGGKK